MFTKAVERKMKADGSRVLSFAVHPGVVNTDLFDGTTLKKVAPWVPALLFKVVLHNMVNKYDKHVVLSNAGIDFVDSRAGSCFSSVRCHFRHVRR